MIWIITYWRAILFVAAVGAAGIGGYRYAANACDAKTLQAENTRLAAALKLKDDQLAAASAIQGQDADRAQAAEQDNLRLRGLIDATPINVSTCLDAAAAKRVRDVK